MTQEEQTFQNWWKSKRKHQRLFILESMDCDDRDEHKALVAAREFFKELVLDKNYLSCSDETEAECEDWREEQKSEKFDPTTDKDYSNPEYIENRKQIAAIIAHAFAARI
jgi:hypothetical protein